MVNVIHRKFMMGLLKKKYGVQFFMYPISILMSIRMSGRKYLRHFAKLFS